VWVWTSRLKWKVKTYTEILIQLQDGLGTRSEWTWINIDFKVSSSSKVRKTHIRSANITYLSDKFGKIYCKTRHFLMGGHFKVKSPKGIRISLLCNIVLKLKTARECWLHAERRLHKLWLETLERCRSTWLWHHRDADRWRHQDLKRERRQLYDRQSTYKHDRRTEYKCPYVQNSAQFNYKIQRHYHITTRSTEKHHINWVVVERLFKQIHHLQKINQTKTEQTNWQHIKETSTEL